MPNQKPRLHSHCFSAFLVVALVLTSLGCQKKKSPAPTEEVAAIDRAGPSPSGSQNVLQKTFAVRTSEVFPFEIPANAAMPRLSGSYKSFVTKLGIQSSEDSANVDFLALTEDQYVSFVRDGSVDALFTAPASHDQNVDLSLPPSINQPRKFYLIFRNAPGGDPKKIVKADLSVNF